MTDRELMDAAADMLQYAYCPYSHFPVGAALLCEDGSVFTGCNVENAAYGSSICAERTALVKAVSAGRQGGFVKLAITGVSEEYCWPCGSCRQMLWEFAPELEVLCGNARGEMARTTLRELLPHGFGASHLAEKVE